MHPIRSVRRARGLTITELALLSGVPARMLGAAEHGIAPLPAQHIVLIAEALTQARIGVAHGDLRKEERRGRHRPTHADVHHQLFVHGNLAYTVTVVIFLMKYSPMI